MSEPGPWFAPARPGQVLGCGKRGQNRAALVALLDCLATRQPILARQGGVPIQPAPADAPLLFCQSSGSGGRVRTIRRSHGSWLASFAINRDGFGISGRDRYGVLGHLGHSLSLYATVEALQLGAGLLVLGGDSPRSQMRQLADQRVTVLYATPAQLRRLQLAADGASLPAMTHIFCGGARLDAACRAGMAALCPNARIREFYGASETSFVTIADEDTPEGSVGRAYPGVRIRIGADGMLWVASPYLAEGYAEAGAPPLPRDGDFISAGDIGHLDAAGHLFLQGRRNRMVTINDRNLFPEDVEAVLAAETPRPCAAIPVPDPQRGHALLAIVEGPPDDALAARLRRACRRALGDHAVPRRVIFVERLPMLASDKPDLAALARDHG